MITRYVNTASTAGGDGTTNLTAGATRAFASLREGLTAQPAVLLDATTIYCEGVAADPLSCLQAQFDFETTAAFYLRIVGNNTSGKWNTSAYRLEISDSSAIYNSVLGHCRIENLQVQVTVTTSSGAGHTCYRLATANNLNSPIDHRYIGCIARIVVSGGATDNVTGWTESDPGGSGGTCVRINCLAYDGYAGFASDSTAWTVANLANYNCTAYGNEFNYIDTQICVNCLSANPLIGDGFGFLATGVAGHFNNASDESSAGGTSARINQVFAFTNTAGRDFHLTALDTGAKGFGLTNPAPTLYTTDIDGETRSDPWDIGADEYVLALPSFSPVSTGGQNRSRR